MLESQYLAGRDDLLESMKKVPFLRSYSDKFLRKILELSKIRRYQAGEVITREGEYDCWLYVILAGEVKVVKNDEEIARLDAAGGTFGELAVIDGEPRSAATFAGSSLFSTIASTHAVRWCIPMFPIAFTPPSTSRSITASIPCSIVRRGSAMPFACRNASSSGFASKAGQIASYASAMRMSSPVVQMWSEIRPVTPK